MSNGFIYNWKLTYRHGVKGFGRTIEVSSPDIEGALKLGRSALSLKYDDSHNFEVTEVSRRSIVGRDET